MDDITVTPPAIDVAAVGRDMTSPLGPTQIMKVNVKNAINVRVMVI